VPKNSTTPTDARQRRGRPALGRPVLVVMNDAEIGMAKELGGGVIAAGVRRALQVCRAIGPQALAEAAIVVREQP